jgi:hypothetical protein
VVCCVCGGVCNCVCACARLFVIMCVLAGVSAWVEGCERLGACVCECVLMYMLVCVFEEGEGVGWFDRYFCDSVWILCVWLEIIECVVSRPAILPHLQQCIRASCPRPSATTAPQVSQPCTAHSGSAQCTTVLLRSRHAWRGKPSRQ